MKIPKALAHLAQVAPKRDPRKVLQTIHVRRSKKGNICEAHATDGRILIAAKWKDDDSPGSENDFAPGVKVNIHHDDWSAMRKLKTSQSAELAVSDDTSGLAWYADRASIKINANKTEIEPFVAKCMDVESVIPKDQKRLKQGETYSGNKTASICLDANLAATLFGAIAKMLTERNKSTRDVKDEHARVRLEFALNGKHPILITPLGEHSEEFDFRALIMPVREEKEDS